VSKKKDCFGSETYVCRTQNCPYMSECVQVVWEKKLRRVIARRGAAAPATRAGAPGALLPEKRAASIRVRSRDFT
jgi:hypothetical protein